MKFELYLQAGLLDQTEPRKGTKQACKDYPIQLLSRLIWAVFQGCERFLFGWLSKQKPSQALLRSCQDRAFCQAILVGVDNFTCGERDPYHSGEPTWLP